MEKAGPVLAAGTMSGTSMDGVDAALVETDGETILGLGRTGYRAYAPAERAAIATALGRWQGEPGVAEAARVVEDAHLALLQDFPEAALIGFHGQTLAHAPRARGTHQAGDGGRLARALGRPVVWDFRSADVALGGEGAPLAPFFHFALARFIGADAPLVFLNLGGVGNLTWVDPSAAAREAAGTLLAFDTRPANAPLDDLMRARRAAAHDAGGALALTGRADSRLIEDVLARAHYRRIPPKSLDRAAFGDLATALAGHSDADAAATLAALAAASVATGFEHLPARPACCLVAGGGRHNAAMMAELARRLPCAVAPIEEEGLDGDMIEAQAFAHLAVRAMRGLPTSAPGTTGVAAAVGGGRISRP